MKRTKEDEKWANLLKQGAHGETENRWFTPRVVNRLPEKRPKSYRWVAMLFYLIAFGICTISWFCLLTHNDFTVITVRDIIYLVMLTAMTMLLTLSATTKLLTDK